MNKFENLNQKQQTTTECLLRIDNIGHHPANSHKEKFTLVNISATTARLTRVGDNGYYNFANKFKIIS